MNLKTLCALLLHHPGVVRTLPDTGFTAWQGEFEGAESYAKWYFIVSAGSFIGRVLPLPDKANGG